VPLRHEITEIGINPELQNGGVSKEPQGIYDLKQEKEGNQANGNKYGSSFLYDKITKSIHLNAPQNVFFADKGFISLGDHYFLQQPVG
jgi:hypothetical protein